MEGARNCSCACSTSCYRICLRSKPDSPGALPYETKCTECAGPPYGAKGAV